MSTLPLTYLGWKSVGLAVELRTILGLSFWFISRVLTINPSSLSESSFY